jgi:hypothetical protein
MGFGISGETGVIGRVTRTVTRCLVCGSCEVRTDEVVDRGIVTLAECPRCEHRWTSHGAVVKPLAAVSPRLREVATAA